MPLDSLDPATALVVIDMQQATSAYATAVDMQGVMARVIDLAEAFRETGRVVVLATADLNDPPGGRTQYGRTRPPIPAAALDLVDGLTPQPDDVLIHRRGWSVFTGTSLDETLRRRGVTQIVLVGLATNFGVESSARSAYDLGYNVIVCSDAVNGPSEVGHQQSLNGLLPALAQIASTDEVRSQLL